MSVSGRRRLSCCLTPASSGPDGREGCRPLQPSQFLAAVELELPLWEQARSPVQSHAIDKMTYNLEINGIAGLNIGVKSFRDHT